MKQKLSDIFLSETAVTLKSKIEVTFKDYFTSSCKYEVVILAQNPPVNEDGEDTKPSKPAITREQPKAGTQTEQCAVTNRKWVDNTIATIITINIIIAFIVINNINIKGPKVLRRVSYHQIMKTEIRR